MFSTNSRIILASKSPRRQELLKLMGLEFTVELREVDETYPEGLQPSEVALYIAKAKASAFGDENGAIVITADTIVVLDDEILGKPLDRDNAIEMLTKLSGKTHQVYTAVCINGNGVLKTFYDVTEVSFRQVDKVEIAYYIDNFEPYDKAGSYGVQDWWGLTVVEKMNGSYTNVMGLPTEKLFAALRSYI